VSPRSDSGASQKSVLLIEDDTDLCLLMTDYFAQYGFRVESAHDGRSGLARALEGSFDLIILDVMLPVLDGFEVLRQLRKRLATPVIMLTARTAQPDRVAGLNAGADDYLPKPSSRETVRPAARARISRMSNSIDVSSTGWSCLRPRRTSGAYAGGVAPRREDGYSRAADGGGRGRETQSADSTGLEPWPRFSTSGGRRLMSGRSMCTSAT